MKIETELRRAIEKGQLELHYQPLVPLMPGRPACLEALLRWRHPARGILLPAEFIEIAESSGLIEGIGRWALRQACHDAAGWEGIPALGPIDVAVNISVRQFAHDTLVHDVQDALQGSGLPAHRLCLEITERLWLRDSEHNLRQIEALRALGVQIAIDDFGVGYSSFQSIERVQPQQIKIDGSLVRACAEDPRKGAIVRAVIAMARSLNATVVAECVETSAQHDFLLAEQCDYGQGFRYSAAVPDADVAALKERLWPLARRTD